MLTNVLLNDSDDSQTWSSLRDHLRKMNEPSLAYTLLEKLLAQYPESAKVKALNQEIRKLYRNWRPSRSR